MKQNEDQKDDARVVEHATSNSVLPQRWIERLHAPVVSYVTEEVSRQGHDVYSLDGIERVGWMLEAWSYALACDRERPRERDALTLGKLVERHRNKRGYRKCAVRVGMNQCPPHSRIPDLLAVLFEQRDALTPLEFYKGFEQVHPFVDGNGRTGKVLLNWLNGTLLEPVFPPSDFWGRTIRNP
jgi:hypothetical protein